MKFAVLRSLSACAKPRVAAPCRRGWQAPATKIDIDLPTASAGGRCACGARQRASSAKRPSHLARACRGQGRNRRTRARTVTSGWSSDQSPPRAAISIAVGPPFNGGRRTGGAGGGCPDRRMPRAASLFAPYSVAAAVASAFQLAMSVYPQLQTSALAGYPAINAVTTPYLDGLVAQKLAVRMRK